MQKYLRISLLIALTLAIGLGMLAVTAPAGSIEAEEEGVEIFGVASNSFGYYIYVADSKHNRVIKYDLQGNYLNDFIKWDPNGDCPGWKYEGLIAVSVCRVTDVFAVTDYKLKKCFTFNPDSVPHHPIGDPAKTELTTPWHASETEIADDIGNYVVDKDGNKFHRYDPPAIDFDKAAVECDVYGIVRFSVPNGYEHKPAPAGDGPGEFNMPEGIAVDRRGYVLIADTGNNRIQKFRRDGEYVTEWNGEDQDCGKFDKPVYIIPDFNADSPNRYYVCDQGNHRVVVFDEYGELITEIKPLDENGEPLFKRIVACAIDMNYNVWVADAANENVYKLSPIGEDGDDEVKLLYTIEKAMDPPPIFTHVTRIIIKKYFGYVDEATVPIKPYAQIVNSRTMVPLRWVAENSLTQKDPDKGMTYECMVDWDADARMATFTLDSIKFSDKLTYPKKVVKVWLGKSTAEINGKSVPIDSNNRR